MQIQLQTHSIGQCRHINGHNCRITAFTRTSTSKRHSIYQNEHKQEAQATATLKHTRNQIQHWTKRQNDFIESSGNKHTGSQLITNNTIPGRMHNITSILQSTSISPPADSNTMAKIHTEQVKEPHFHLSSRASLHITPHTTKVLDIHSINQSINQSTQPAKFSSQARVTIKQEKETWLGPE
ncbi:hypothetical protein HRR83_006118 [Exophiala dermatitidis]|uniref:Uncharacterized protein n=2 Tax=Exophiala dermatitidis TaxID=5970 RepID=H6BML5_EXODN|nr:uncharacterized protein HMPREF1120_01243 [Exophiala dermatitidis NIH/UT8656]KAJ4515050.1 hypothetical protein HRR74_005515 [Exophiala dermatitidis]EHY53042.1 hypothetical protein HMPREF1120_01243 [Exophiala dermatitidis NIH/UT8656]KAJ4548700.1 hypothetical protein HRR76_001287 [Exophiala dermatitidis]KAJ4552582.1 hypothetical protein HRR77_002584 [Exophiala dermatitidis]KAJ4567084.1 hypothetical protein HRR81_007160 [Exophiala dermatitidis]